MPLIRPLGDRPLGPVAQRVLMDTLIIPRMRVEIDVAHALHLKHPHNRLFALRAFDIARRFAMPVPDWVVAALAEMATGVLRDPLPDRTDASAKSYRWALELATRFGFKSGRGGRVDPFAQMAREYRRMELAIRVRVCIDCDKSGGRKKAAGIVARHCGRSLNHVLAAWRDYGVSAQAGALDDQCAFVRPDPADPPDRMSAFGALDPYDWIATRATVRGRSKSKLVEAPRPLRNKRATKNS